MLRKDDDYGFVDDAGDYKHDSMGGSQKKRRRRRLRDHSGPRCAIL